MNVKPENLPAALRETGLFCGWRYETRPGSDKPTKVPYDPKTGCRASSTDPATFSSLGAALTFDGDGVGVGIFGSLGAIDIDHCIDAAGGYSDMAVDIISTVNAYTEISPSGHGLRILFTTEGFQYDKARYYINNQALGLEVYIAGCTNKYVTVTGNALAPGYALEERGRELTAVLEKYMVRPTEKAPAPLSTAPNAPVDLDDPALVERAKQSKNGAGFAALWAGDTTGYKSRSEADMALCNALAWWSNGDAARVDRLFRMSGLMREKWDRKQSGSTYGAVTVQNAVNFIRGGYDPVHPGESCALDWDGSRDTGDKPKQEDSFLSLFKTLDQFEEEEATWLVPGWIPEGQITLIAAGGGLGKTSLWVNILVALSTGGACILDPPGHTRNPVKVAFLTTEDSVKKKLRKKLREAGANMKNITTMDLSADRTGELRDLKFGSPKMKLFVERLAPVAGIFDPVQGFIPPDVNMGSRNAMRDCMAPLISLGEDVGTAFLVICHTNKRKGAYGRDRIADSADLWDIARSVIMMGYTETQGIRYLSNEKNNYAPLQETILYSLNDSGLIVKEGTTWKREREYMQEAVTAKSAPQREDCKAFILNVLEAAEGHAMTSDELTQKAQAAGYSFNAIRHAKSDLKGEGRVENYSTGSAKGGDRTWHIRLSSGANGFEELPTETPTPFEE